MKVETSRENSTQYEQKGPLVSGLLANCSRSISETPIVHAVVNYFTYISERSGLDLDLDYSYHTPIIHAAFFPSVLNTFRGRSTCKNMSA